MKKISRLKNNPEIMKKLIPTSMSYSLIIYPTDPSIPDIIILNKTPPRDVADVSVVNRTIEYDHMLIDLYLSIKSDFIESDSDYVCTQYNMDLTHKRPDLSIGKFGWLCKPFNINLDAVNSKDFYILTDPPILRDISGLSNRWIIDTPDKFIITSHKYSSNPILITPIISELFGNKTTQTCVLHVFTNPDPGKTFNTYIVGVPKGTPVTEVRIYRINPPPAF
jgi:hypothetical protein